MESNYRNREFEQFVKESADQYRMFPSEKVWKGINNTLHTRRKWYGLGLGLLLLLTGTAVTWVMVSYPVSKDQKTTAVPAKDLSNGQGSAITPSTSATATPRHHNVLPFSNSTELEDNTTGSAGQATAPAQDALLLQEQQLIVVPVEDQFISITTVKPQVSTIISARPKAANPTADPVNIGIADVPAFIITDASLTEQQQTAATDKNTTEEKTAVQHPLLYPVPNDAIAINTTKPRAISWQFFITPTISYRKLTENKSFDNSGPSGIPAAPKDDVNNQVTHKPDMGLQLGFAARYKLTKSLKLRGGFQFNINRYDIKAVAYNPELATIELNGADGATLATWTSYRNNRKGNSYRSDWLKNFYFSISAPIGAEIIVLGKNKKTSFGVAGTIQPTYIIKDRAYVISSNYKNYANIPSLTRHVNVNTGFEAFVNYTSGKTKWQVGPQVRYQVLSSFNNKYPVKENLFDFGVKIGVTLND
jgi:hypothetical protein